ncbi:MAG: NB-ARC domain-containing protein, partial [Ktedonobacteraceae bacterium]
MKKAAQAVPNQRLRAQRELRGWSQKYVAEQIGADHYYLSRWERGTAMPSPHYRQKLCVLFGQNARELGLQPKSSRDSSTESPVETATVSSSLTIVVHDPFIPPLTAGTLRLVGREDLLDHLKQRLFSHHNLVLTALNGLPGVGKTALAVALVHDNDVGELFHHGILWAGLGPQPNVLGQLSRWGTLLGISAAQGSKLTSIEAWAQAIHAALGSRSMLLVIDDAWEIDHALAFKVGGPNCAYLLTTRFPHIAVQFAADGATIVHELNEQESITLLTQLAPEVIKSELQSVQEIVSLVGGLPLALTLIGKYLAAQGYSGQPRRIRSAIERLRDAEARLQLSEPKALLERTPSLPRDASVSLQSVIEVSDLRLDEQGRQVLRALSVFPAKPNSFSKEAALAVSASPADILDTLCDAGLLESKGWGRYTLH